MEPDWKEVSTLIRRHSATFYYGSLLFRGEARKGAWAVYGACRVGDNAVDESKTPAADLAAWWAGIERAYAGHPVQEWEKGLSWALERWAIPQDALADMHRGFLTDLGPVRLQSLDELNEYCYRVAGTVGRMILPVAGGNREGETAAIKLGQAMQLTNCLRDVGEDLAMNRVYLPAELLSRYEVVLDDLHQGRTTPQYITLMQNLSYQTRQLYHQGIAGLHYLHNGRAAIALAALQYQGILDKLETAHWDNLSGRASLSALERVRLLPRALWLRSRPMVQATE